MAPAPSWLADPALRRELSRGLDAPVGPAAAGLAAYLARAFGPSAAALVHYGSHLHGAGPRAESAYDFFVVLDAYRTGYRALPSALGRSFPVTTAVLLNHVLPPNVLSMRDGAGAAGALAKCAILSRRDLARACSAHPRDHFVRARLFQHVQVAWARDAATCAEVKDAIVSVRAGTFEWGRPFLPARFDGANYCRTLLEVSYRGEVRPESDDHVDAILAAQREVLVPVYQALLERLAAAGELEPDGGGFRDRRPPGPWSRFLARRFFGWSKARATMRWAKYMALYDDWLDYVVQKVERRSGVPVELSPRERRWPFLFLWPKALRLLSSRASRRR